MTAVQNFPSFPGATNYDPMSLSLGGTSSFLPNMGGGNLEAEQMAYFGMPMFGDPSFNRFGDVPEAYKTFPQAWGGPDSRARNDYVQYVIMFSIQKVQRPILRDILPLRLLDNGAAPFKITQLIYDNYKLDAIPELGVPRLVENRSRSWEVNGVRQGLAFMMEDGFRMTEKGKRDYAMSIAQIRNATWLVLEHDGYYRLLSAPRQHHATQGKGLESASRGVWRQLHTSLGVNAAFTRQIETEAMFTGILNRQEHGFIAVLNHARRIGQSRQVNFDACILPHGGKALIGDKEFFQQYKNTGPDVDRAFKNPDGNFEKFERPGLDIYESDLYPAGTREMFSDDDLLVRTRAWGTFFFVENSRFHGMDVSNGFNSSLQDIQIYDFDADALRRITIQSVLTHTPSDTEFFSAIGRKMNGTGVDYEYDWKECVIAAIRIPSVSETIKSAWREALVGTEAYDRDHGDPPRRARDDNGGRGRAFAEGGDEVTGDVRLESEDTGTGAGDSKSGHVGEGSETKRRRRVLPPADDWNMFIGNIQGRAPVPFNFLIQRLCERWDMGSIIFCVKNQTGFSGIGMPDFQLQHDGVRKYLVGTFTVYTTTVVTHPQNVEIMHNAAFGRYHNGGNTEFCESRQELEQLQQNNEQDAVALSSLISCVVAPTEHLNVRTSIDATGTYGLRYESRDASTSHLHFSTAAENAHYWGLVNERDEDTFWDVSYFDQERALSGSQTRMMRGMQIVASVPRDSNEAPTFNMKVTGAGQHGAYCGDNDRQIKEHQTPKTHTPTEPKPYADFHSAC